MLIGKDCNSAVGTLVERATRQVLLLHLPRKTYLAGHAARQAITAQPAPSPRTKATKWPARQAHPNSLLALALARSLSPSSWLQIIGPAAGEGH